MKLSNVKNKIDKFIKEISPEDLYKLSLKHKMEIEPQWNGQPVKIEHIQVKVRYNKEKPLYWYNYECLTSGDPNGYADFPAIEITTENGYKFIISNHAGTGINKVMKGGCIGTYSGHFDKESIVEIYREDYFDFLPDKSWCEFKFDEEAYAQREVDCRKWQKEMYPEEFDRVEKMFPHKNPIK